MKRLIRSIRLVDSLLGLDWLLRPGLLSRKYSINWHCKFSSSTWLFGNLKAISARYLINCQYFLKVCEDIGNIQVIKNVSSRYLVDQYLNQNVPVVVSDGTLDWPTFNDPNFNLKNIAHVIKIFTFSRLQQLVKCHTNHILGIPFGQNWMEDMPVEK